MEYIYYLTKICYASLGMKRNITKKLRSITKEKEDHPKAVWTKNKENSSNTGGSRRPRAHGPPRPRAHGLHRNLTLEHPVRTGLYHAHGPPVCTGPTYPVRTGLPGWPAEIASSAPLLLPRPQGYIFRTKDHV